MSKFVFYKKMCEDKPEQDAIVVRVPVDIVEKSEIFIFYSQNLRFPPYFGRNWDALYDCLCDLSWINEYNIALIHEDLPFSNDETERNVYITLLSDVLANWERSSLHKLQIFFPEKYEQLINRS